MTFLFISHHLDEVPQVCDAVTVLRNGTDVLHGRAADLSTADMVSAMVGDDGAGPTSRKKTSHRGRPRPGRPRRARGRGAARSREHRSVLATLRAGEVVGLAGHAGSGSRQIALSLAGPPPGLDRRDHAPGWTRSGPVAGIPTPPCAPG